MSTPMPEELAAFLAEDYSEAWRLHRERLFRDALAVLEQRGFVAPRQGAASLDAYIDRVAVSLAVDGTSGGIAPARDALAAKIIRLIASADFPSRESGPQAIGHFGLVSAMIGHAAGMLWAESQNVFHEAADARQRRVADRKGQAGSVAVRTSWEVPALALAKQARSANPSISSRAVARLIHKRLKDHDPPVPDVSQIATRTIPKWERADDLPTRQK